MVCIPNTFLNVDWKGRSRVHPAPVPCAQRLVESSAAAGRLRAGCAVASFALTDATASPIALTENRDRTLTYLRKVDSSVRARAAA